MCWQRSDADPDHRPIEPWGPQNRGYLGYHLVRENATTAIYEPVLNGRRHSLLSNTKKGWKSFKNSPPPWGRRDNSG